MTDAIARRPPLRAIAQTYITDGLGKKHFDSIPIAAHITLRTLHCPSGTDVPLANKIVLFELWWAPLLEANIQFLKALLWHMYPVSIRTFSSVTLR